jgi:DNA-binding response OmpR family regulator
MEPIVPRILFVDDDADLLEAMQDIVRVLKLGTTVVAASLEEVQAKRAEVLSCTLAVLDLNLGVDLPNGIDVFRWLRAEGFTGMIAFLTGHGASDPRVKAAVQLESGRILTKPIELDDLAELVRAAHPPR